MYYRIESNLITCSKKDCLASGSQYVVLLSPEEWQQERDDFEMGIDMEPDAINIYTTKAEVNYDSVTGAFSIPDRNNMSGDYHEFAFALDEKGIVFIDPGNIVLTGNSAGAIISLAAEYDILCGRAQGLPEGFNFKGIMAFAGAIISLKGAPDFPAAPCPLLLMHGTADKAVAYDHYGVMGRGLWGSSYLAENLAKKGYRYSIYRYKDRTHDVAAYVETLWDLEEDFIENDVILGRSRTIDAMVDDPGLPTWGDISLDSIYRKK